MSANLIPVSDITLSQADRDANARDLRDARAPRTQHEYAKHVAAFTCWCERQGHAALPCSLDVLAAYLRGLRDGTATTRGKGYAPSSIEVALSAITAHHRLAGYAINRKASLLTDYAASAKRHAGVRHIEKQKAPLRAADLQTIVATLRRDDPADIRDRAILTFGFAGALRRVEISGLDYGLLGGGTGFIAMTDQGIAITLSTSKSSQGDTVKLAIPCADMRSACDALLAWINHADLQHGTPLFRAISKSGRVLATRLGPQGINLAIQARVYASEMAQGEIEANARETAKRHGGHSLRAGFVTTAAEKGLPTYKIQEQSRHASADMVKRYIRDANAWNDNALKKIGF